MGNRYRCAGSASETYINNIKTNDRVDINSVTLPVRPVPLACFAELNGVTYIATLSDFPVTEFYIYTFDGIEFKKKVTLSSLSRVASMCAYNNAVYFTDEDGVNLFRIDGENVSIVTTLPEGTNTRRTLFSLGIYMYLLESKFEYGYSNKIYRFTGSGWTQVLTFSGELYNPTCVLFSGGTHILSYRSITYSDDHGVWHTELRNIHKVFNGSTISDAATVPDASGIQVNAAYVYNNKLRVFEWPSYNQNLYLPRALDFNGSSWTPSSVLNFEGFVRENNLFAEFQAFELNNEQYLFNVCYLMMIKITNPIRLGQFTVSS